MLVKLLTTRAKRGLKNALSINFRKVKVKVNQGTIVGCEEKLPNGQSFKSFSGIPYAIPPINELRFQSPQKLLKFDHNELDCTKERDACFHKSPIWRTYVGSEDCLNLNVYVPEHDTSKKLAVMVFIHGGGFMFDSNSRDFYSPEYLLMEDVIVVTINYRLHSLGFLSLPDVGIAGNAGMKDQQMALEWVYENITNFNGDPEKICLFSESAGSAATHLQVLSSKSRKFFKSAIVQSGTAIADWVIQADSTNKARSLAKLLGSKGSSDKDHLEFLRKAPLQDLFDNCHKVLSSDERRRNLPLAFKPIIEQESDDAFMTQHPIDLIKNQQNYINIPMIFGTTSADGAAMVSDYRKKLQQFNKDMVKTIPMSLKIDPNSSEAEKLAAEIKNFYFGDRELTNENLSEFSDLMTDYHFLIPQSIANELQALYQPASKQYLFEFGFEGELNLFKKLLKMEKVPGACHADELSYLFKAEIGGLEVNKGTREWKMRETMCKLWTNFAKYENPTPHDNNPLPFQWTPLEVGQINNLDYLAINEESKMVRNIHLKRMNFWRDIYKKYNGAFISEKYSAM